LYAAKFAEKIALSYDEATKFFTESQKKRIAVTGNPVRKDAMSPAHDGVFEFLELEKNVPVVLILGGSTGAEAINDVVLAALPELIQRYQIIHQTGNANFKLVTETAKVVLDKNERRYRYKAFPYLNTLALKMAAGASELVISRAGSGAIAEIALWGKAAILIPIPEAVSRDQRANAYAYARAGACVVLEQANLAPHLLISEIDRLFTNPKSRNDMAEAAKKFAKPNAARAIAEALLKVGLEHSA
jgi:UDP-N-acetylglucosamine--N-acetylmuramyl-(pentapeptide) pyrophosphoryl-undecaprenol N-acetylglucosamine transferase